MADGPGMGKDNWDERVALGPLCARVPVRNEASGVPERHFGKLSLKTLNSSLNFDQLFSLLWASVSHAQNGGQDPMTWMIPSK